jgi:hypothetical protein
MFAEKTQKFLSRSGANSSEMILSSEYCALSLICRLLLLSTESKIVISLLELLSKVERKSVA